MNPWLRPVRLSYLVALLACGAALSGLFLNMPSGPETAPTPGGAQAELFGEGLYRRDTVFAGAGNRGTDAVSLLLGIPAILAAAQGVARGKGWAKLLLTATLGYFLYVYSNFALGTALNELFLLYVVILSASFWGFVASVHAWTTAPEPTPSSALDPPRGLPAFLIASGVATTFIWASPVVLALVSAEPPARLDIYTTLATTALDLAIIAPATLITAVLLRKRSPLGFPLAVSLLFLEAMLLPLITMQTVSQVRAGITFPPAEIIGPIAGFLLLAVTAGWFPAKMLKNTKLTHNEVVQG